MKFLILQWKRVAYAYHTSLAKLFISRCLLFRSPEWVNWLLGVIAWLSMVLFAYAIYNIWMLSNGLQTNIQ